MKVTKTQMSIIIQREKPDKLLQMNQNGKVSSVEKVLVASRTSDPLSVRAKVNVKEGVESETENENDTMTINKKEEFTPVPPTTAPEPSSAAFIPSGLEKIANPEKIDIPASTAYNSDHENRYNNKCKSDGDGGSCTDNDNYKVPKYDSENDTTTNKISLHNPLPRHDYYSTAPANTTTTTSTPPNEHVTPAASVRMRRQSGSDTGNDSISEDQEKSFLLNRLDRMKAKGYNVNRDFTMNSRLSDVKKEYQRIKGKIDSENALKCYRQYLLMFCTTAEYLNNAYNPYDMDLDGWTIQVHDTIEVHDDVFERLHEKYSKKFTNTPPELSLAFALGVSAITYNVSKRIHDVPRMAANNGGEIESNEKLEAFRRKIMKDPELYKQYKQSIDGGDASDAGILTREDIPVSRTTPGLMTDGYGREFMPNQAGPPPPKQVREMRGPSGNINEQLEKMKKANSGNGGGGGYLSTNSNDSDVNVPNSDSDNNVSSKNIKRVAIKGGIGVRGVGRGRGRR
jgi:hypothetical protein